MCLGLAKIYPNEKLDNVSNVDLDELKQLCIQKNVSFEVMKWVI